MSPKIKKAGLAAIAALALVTAGVGPAAARHGGHGGHHFGGHFHGGGFGGGFIGGLALGAIAGAPYGYGYYDPYGYNYGPDCYIRRRVVVTRWGYRVIRRVRVCY